MQPNLLLPFFSTDFRRVKAIYYLLTGKRTISNLSAGLEYGLLPYFRIFPKLSQADYFKALAELTAQHYLVQRTDEQPVARLTTTGKLAKTVLCQQDYWLHSVNYFEIGDWQIQWEKLMLSVQVISNYRHHITKYIPTTNHPLLLREIRHWFYRVGAHQQQEFIDSLAESIAQLPKLAQTILVNSLHSETFAGVSDFQLAQDLQLTGAEFQLARIEAISSLMTLILAEDPARVLPSLFQVPEQTLSRSAQRTYDLVQQGKSWSQIQQMSRQKEGTLKEHLLEAAILLTDFDFKAPLVRQIGQEDPEGFFAQKLTQIKSLKEGVSL
ncbi:hypothetical protein ACFQ4L_09415 [Lapidilactobacillus mulanensis]|uniref:Helicase Helix-turn-helix domain-containing protein n=1 Tax=Lapidilactobacillus mulanensis TaxID=2485999 RepID=A0ABW4DR76_9LACO|nr:hypothetical protein [Lapidilactobacillus mulanensis]